MIPDDQQNHTENHLTHLDDHDLDDVATIITHALMTFKPVRGSNRLARAEHIVHILNDNGWHLTREDE